MAHKNRKQKAEEYNEKYSDIPINYEERLNWMIEKYNLSDKKMDTIIQKKNMMLQSLQYNDLMIVLYEEPEGTPRPRFRLVNRQNFVNEAVSNSQFVHVYSINAHEDNLYMKRLVSDELFQLNSKIYTPCIVEFNMYIKTPEVFNIEDKFLSEIGIIRPLCKPDFDNAGKKYSDMFNQNIWLDDSLVISGTVNKFYSILPRVEIKLRYLNMLYNKYQYNSTIKKTDQQVIYFNNGRK